MTWLLDIIIALIIGVSIFLGAKNGFVKTAIGAAAFIIMKISANGARPYLLIVRANNDVAVDQVARFFAERGVRTRLSSLTDNGEYCEIIYEISVKGAHQKLVSSISNIPDVVSVSLVDCRN